jgi:hypothetical protein
MSTEPAPSAAAADEPSPVQLLLVVLLAVGFLVFPYLVDSPRGADRAVGNELVGDGLIQVAENPAQIAVYTEGDLLGTLTSPWWWGDQERLGLYRPLASFTLGVLGNPRFDLPYDPDDPGGRAFPYHLVVLGLHAACSLLVVQLGRRLLSSGRAAFLAGALFATLPVHGEVFFDVAGIAELLAACFGLGAWIAWLRAGEEGGTRGAWTLLSLVLLFAATLSKEHAFALPLVFVLTDAGLAREGGFGAGVRHALRRAPALVGCAAVLAVSLWIRYSVLGTILLDLGPEQELDNPLIAASGPGRIVNALRVLAATVPLMFGLNFLRGDGSLATKLGFSADYSLQQVTVESLVSVGNLAGLAFLVLVIGGAVVWFQRCRVRASLVLAYFASLLLSSNVLFATGTVFGERLLYFPSVAAVLVLGATLARWGRAGSVLGLALALALGLWTNALSQDWRDSRTLWKHTATVTAPRSARAHYNYAAQAVADGVPSLAIPRLERAISSEPSSCTRCTRRRGSSSARSTRRRTSVTRTRPTPSCARPGSSSSASTTGGATKRAAASRSRRCGRSCSLSRTCAWTPPARALRRSTWPGSTA